MAAAAEHFASESIQLKGTMQAGFEEILTPDALAFLATLHRRFDGRRRELLAERIRRQASFDAGQLPDFRDDTRAIREGAWSVAPIPTALQDRRVEITGPVERKMIINALNSGAKVFMGDFEDSLTPNWPSVMDGKSTCAIGRMAR